MPRSKKSLVQRCYERSFRPRHHWHLLVSEPDLPVSSLAELQQRARAAEAEDAVKHAARLVGRRLGSLTPDELRLLGVQSPSGRDDAPKQARAGRVSAGRTRNAVLAVAEAALAEIAAPAASQLTAREILEVELTRRAAEGLAEIDQRLTAEGLTVRGSKQQLRPHPLLAGEAGLLVS